MHPPAPAPAQRQHEGERHPEHDAGGSSRLHNNEQLKRANTFDPFEDPKMLGSFVIGERLGVGGAATVHRATWTEPASGDVMSVALKRLHPHLADDAMITDAFLTEARVGAALDHRNICRFLDVGRLDDQLYIAMEYVHGTKLSTLLRRASRARRPPPIDVVVYLVAQLCDALHHAHTANDRLTGEPLELVHRDVSPSNIIITQDGELKLLDFGIAKSVCNQHATKTGVIKGTLGYMPPEVVCGFTADWRADIFSAGVIAWELLCARPLFGGGGNEIAIYDRVFACHVDPPSSLNKACSPALDAIILRSLRRMWLERWSSAAEMADALRRLAEAESLRPGMAAVATWVRTLPKPVRAVAMEPSSETECTAVYQPDVATKLTTAAWQRPVAKLPRAPRFFPYGTGSTKTIERPAGPPRAPLALPLPPPPRREVPTEIVFRPDGLLWFAVVALLALAATTVWAASETFARSEPVFGAAASAPAATPAIAAGDLAALRPVPAVHRRRHRRRRRTQHHVDRPRRVPVHRLAVRYVTWPRSSWSKSRYRARLCMDRNGHVTRVDVLRAARDMRARIRHHLMLWRFAPYAPDGHARPVCTEVHDHIRPRHR